jgi:cytochrome P450
VALPGPRSPTDLVRTAVGLQRRPWDALTWLHDRFGPVCAFGVRPFRYVVLFGADANKLILADRPDAFRWREAMRVLEPVDGPTALVLSDGDEHKRRRRLVQPAFHMRRINGYVSLMVSEVDRTLDGWTAGRTVDAFTELRRTVRRITIRSLFGDELRNRADEIGDVLEPALEFVNLPLTSQIKLDVPWSRWHRCKRARRQADEIVNAELARRRAGGRPDDQGADILAMLLSSRDEDGGPGLSDDEIRDQVVSLIAAGYDTTSSALAWAVRALCTRPDVWAKAKAEVDELVGNRAPTAEVVASMRYLDGVVHETLRLWPPALVSGRRSVEPVTFAGQTIPAGSMVLYSPWVTHRMPSLWEDPERFDPSRWESEPVPFSFVPFGGGYRRCIGFAFATLELKVALARLLQRVELEALQADATPAGIAALHPKGGVPVRVVAQN